MVRSNTWAEHPRQSLGNSSAYCGRSNEHHTPGPRPTAKRANDAETRSSCETARVGSPPSTVRAPTGG